MPGLNNQGPDGNGPLTGRQQGMCRRTDELPLRGRRDGQGRGVGGRCRGTYFDTSGGQAGSTVNRGDQFSQAEAEQLASLKADYKKTQSMLTTLMKKIEGLEGNKESPESDRT
ncbi:MAG: hypothetical protein ACI8ZB_002347 [Desulforhopalus sp.]|jgi:hypothetical protein